MVWMTNKIDDLAQKYKTDPAAKNENLLAAECLGHIKKIVIGIKNIHKVQDPDDLESFLCLRTVQFMRKWAADSDVPFGKLYAGFLQNMAKNYYVVQPRGKQKVNHLTNYIENIEDIGDSGYYDSTDIIEIQDLINKFKSKLTNPFHIAIVNEIENLGEIKLHKIADRLGVHYETIKRHLVKIRKILIELD